MKLRARHQLGILFLFGTLVLSGCGGSDATPADGDTSAKTVKGDAELANDDIEAVFDAIAKSDVDAMTEAEKFVAPGSVAAAYLQEQRDATNADIDGGTFVEGSAPTKVKGGYKSCADSEDEESCVVWAGFESVDGKLASLTINDIDISDRVSVGDGSEIKAGDLGTVEFLSAYKSVQSGNVFVNVRITSNDEPVYADLYSAAYRGKDKRQTTASNASGNSDLDADSMTYASLIFEADEIGGTAKLDVSDENFNRTETVEVKTS